MVKKPKWLPEIIKLSDYSGDWNKYLIVIYRIFKRDFFKSPPKFEKKKVCVLVKPITDGKECGFWHLISEGKVEENRTTDLRRCERINWPKPIIINCNKNMDLSVALLNLENTTQFKGVWCLL